MSGSGTNIGIEYQQRVSAWFLLQLHLGTSLDIFFRNFTDKFVAKELQYETTDPIDDLKIKGDISSLYAQIKRNISLSSKKKSDFYSVLSQITREYFGNKNDSKYLLITSSLSSKKIRIEFGKITDSIRLNKVGFSNNPLNSSETETFELIKRCFESIAIENGYQLSENDILTILERSFVFTFDIERTQSLEIASLVQIKTITEIDPEYIWSILITKSLELAGKRMSISKEGIKNLLMPFLNTDNSPVKSISNSLFEMVFPKDGEFSSGMEFFLGKMMDKGKTAYVILDFYRFDEYGNSRIKIDNGYVKLSNGLEFEVIFRCSTSTRLTQMIKSSEYVNEKIVYIQSKNQSEVENNKPFALAWSDKLSESINNPNLLYCIHCSKYVSEHEIYSVEYIDNGNPKVGVVHKNCLKNTDRIIGYIEFPLFEEREWLKYFDIEKWIYSYRRSVNTIERSKQISGRPINIGWDDSYQYSEGEFCIGLTLSDGSVEYIHKRAKIESFPESQKETELDYARKMIRQGQDINDPWCYLAISRQFGRYSYLLTQKTEDEDILEITNCFVDNYSLPVRNNYEKAEFYYAPLLFLADIKSGKRIHLGHIAVILSNPFELNRYLSNWQMGGETISDYKIEVLENDEKVDQFFNDEINKGFEVIVDPLIDRNSAIVSGIPIKKMSDMVKDI